MAERATSVALLFDDGSLGAQLREALAESGARIAHEGPLSSLDRALLQREGIDVVVVNLGDEDDDALDRLYESIDGDRPRVVFNDAQASRALEGWDRARWARHLATKVLAGGDVDPPRPEDARPYEPAVPAVPAREAADAAPVVGDEPLPLAAAVDDPAPAVEPPSPAVAFLGEGVPEAEAAAVDATDPDAGTVAAPDDHSLDWQVPDVGELAHDPHAAETSENLAAELEALLARDEAPAEDEFGSGLNYAAGEGQALQEGDFLDGLDFGDEEAPAEPLPASAAAPAESPDAGETSTAAAAAAAGAGLFAGLELAEQGDDDGPLAGPRPKAEAAPAAPSWSLATDEELAAAKPTAAAGAFGVQKVSAADFLAPDAGEASDDESPVSPGLSLELVSIEEAIAPKEYQPTEMLLDELSGAISRVVLLGATTESTSSVREFLAALPEGLRAVVLHTQHTAGKPADALVEYLGEHSALPVRVAEPGQRARAGEVLVVPAGQQVQLRRDGSVELQPDTAQGAHSPSIDASFTLAANAFGRDALAILFAGQSTDAVGGCQAVYDRGGQVWVEESDGHFADMVGAVMAERLFHFAGKPRELAARLAEQFPTGS